MRAMSGLSLRREQQVEFAGRGGEHQPFGQQRQRIGVLAVGARSLDERHTLLDFKAQVLTRVMLLQRIAAP